MKLVKKTRDDLQVQINRLMNMTLYVDNLHDSWLTELNVTLDRLSGDLDKLHARVAHLEQVNKPEFYFPEGAKIGPPTSQYIITSPTLDSTEPTN